MLRPAELAARTRFDNGRVMLRVTTNSTATSTSVSTPSCMKRCQGGGGSGCGAATRNSRTSPSGNVSVRSRTCSTMRGSLGASRMIPGASLCSARAKSTLKPSPSSARKLGRERALDSGQFAAGKVSAPANRRIPPQRPIGAQASALSRASVAIQCFVRARNLGDPPRAVSDAADAHAQFGPILHDQHDHHGESDPDRDEERCEDASEQRGRQDLPAAPVIQVRPPRRSRSPLHRPS